MIDVDRTEVALAVGEPLGSLVLDGVASVEPVDVPGVAEGAVWHVVDASGPHPIHAYVGRWPDGSARVLSADQAAWTELVAAVGANITDAEQARAYVEAYLEVTRGSMVLVRPVDDLDGLPWRPGSDDEEAAKAALLADPPDLTPTSERTDDGFHVSLPLVVDQRLQRTDVDVTESGGITSSFKVLAEGLPFPIAR